MSNRPGESVAHADPTVAQIEAQIQAVWNETEPLIEHYNAVHEEYQRNKARQDGPAPFDAVRQPRD